MTSGHFHSHFIEAITVPEDRQRKELKNIDELVKSIATIGLIHPIVVTRELVLVAGLRRLTACKQFGYTSIICQYVDEIDPITLRLIELEENIRRDDLPWPDKVMAIKEVHTICKSQHEHWTQEDTAKKTGWAQSTIAEFLLAAETMEKQPEITKKSLATAVHLGNVENSRAAEAAKQKILGHDMVRSVPDGPILHADFTTWAQTYDGLPFNFIHCDFPYGIGSDKFHQGATQIGTYDDSVEIFDNLCETLARSLDRICADDAHIIFWFSSYRFRDVFAFLSVRCGFTVDPFPLIWLKSDNVGVLPDVRRGFRRVYETAFFGYRGDAKVISPRSNAIALPTSIEGIHPHEKPVPVLTHFFGAFINEHTRAFDPTAGSGTALRAAKACGAGLVLGTEADEEFARRANEEYAKGAYDTD